MTIALLTLILLGYMKLTGKTLPFLDKIKKSKQSKNITNIAEKEIKTIDINRMDNLSFKSKITKKNYLLYNKNYTSMTPVGNLKI